MTIKIIHCDKCNSTDVLHEQIVEKPFEEHLTMTEVVSESKKLNSVHDVYVYTHYRMVCKNCGYILKYYV
jgi:predicted nucleic-acid-binding Zn-ribbon protein